MARIDSLANFLEDVANAIRLKKGTSGPINCVDFDTEIASIQGGETPTPPSSDKCLISIIDDDGTNRTSDTYTGIRSFLRSKNIPMAFAVPTNAPGGGGSYSLAQLKQMVSEGDEVLMHGVTTSDNANSCTLEEFKTMVDAGIVWASENGFSDDIFVYPMGLQPGKTGVDVDDKIGYLETKGIRAAFNVNTSIENSNTEGYENWYRYENGHAGLGMFNIVPLATMPNGYSKALLLNRCEFLRNNLTVNWWKTMIDDAIQSKRYICFFFHSYQSAFSTRDEHGKTATDYFKDLIEYIIDTYGEAVEFVTPSSAMDIINLVQ